MRRATFALLATFLLTAPALKALALQVHEQYSDKERVWFDLKITKQGKGKLLVHRGSFWLYGQKYQMPAYKPHIGKGAFYLWIEKTETGADYFLDLIGEAEPNSFGHDTGAILVAWRLGRGKPINILRSIKDE